MKGIGSFFVPVLLSLIMLTLAVLLPELSSSQGATVIDFGNEVSESLEDRDHNGRAEYLVINVTVNVYEPGSYILHGTIGGDQISASFGPEALEIGAHELQLKFSGGDIALYDVSGHYQLKLELYSTDSTVDPVIKELATAGTYDPDDFEAPQGTGRVSVRSEMDRVYVEGDPLTISVNHTFPQLTFYYTADEGKGSSSSLTYTTLIAFDDSDGNGIWNPDIDEKKYEGDLTKVDWDLDLDVKNGIEISLYGVVQLRLVGTATVAAWAKVTFKLSSTLLIETYESQKFDIDIDLWQPLDATHLAILHTMKDDTGDRTIESGPSDGQAGDTFQLRVVDGRGKTQNIYTWTDDILVGYSSLDTGSKAVTWFTLTDDGADIWFSYPLQGDVQVIHHDPTVGVDPRNVTMPKSKEAFIRNSLLIMVGGLALGILVVGATLYSRKVAASRRKGGDI